MSERTFAEPKKSTLPPVAGRHPESPGYQHQPPAATENDYLTTVGHEFSRVAVAGPQRATPGFSQSCPMSLDTPRACPFGGACHSCPAPVQAKLTISQPGDRYEQEADRVADRVMAMPEPAGRLQRECSDCEDEAHRQPVEEEEDKEEVARKLIQRQAEPGGPEEEEEPPTAAAKAQPGHKPVVSPGVAADIQGLRSSGGQPLLDSARAFFEPRFGHDFSRVRVHADSKAANTAQAVQAKAFTVGRNIVFGGGQYAPDTQGGRRLLAHELAHVVQQGGKRSISQSIIHRQAGGATPVGCGTPIILDGFQVGGYRLRPRHYTPLLRISGGLEALGGADAILIIEGHTDSTGKELMNVGLSLNRALEVQRFLGTLGVALPTEIKVLGETRPRSSNKSKAGRRKNRRVEVRLCKQPPSPPKTA